MTAPAPVVRPPARPVPARKEGWAPYKGVAATVGGLLVLGVLLFFAVSFFRPPEPAPDASSSAAVPVALGDNDAFLQWLSKWKSVEPYVSRAEFTPSSEVQFTLGPAPAGHPTLDDLRAPRTSRYVWSEDRGKFVDLLFAYPDDPALAIVYGRGGATFETLRPCEDGCTVEKAFWTGASSFALLGRMPARNGDGTPLCIDAQDGSGRRCFERLWVGWYDLDAMKVKSYLSSPHVFAAHPTDDDRRAMWAKGLTPEEQVGADVIPQSLMERMIGTIAVMSPNGSSFTVDGGQFGMEAIKIIGATRIRDENGQPVQFNYLRHGLSVDIHGERAEGPILIASEIDVTKAPDVLMTEPQAGTLVHGTFGVIGAARADAFPLALSLADAATGRVVWSGKVKKPAGLAGQPYLDFVQEAKIALLGLKPGTALTFTAAPASGKAALTLDLTYQP